MKRRIFIVIAVLLVCWTGFYGSGYWRSTRHPEIVNPPVVAELIPSAPLSPGDKITVQTGLSLPRCRRILNAGLTADEALTLAGQQKISCIKGGWSERLWEIQIPMRAIRPKTVPAGTMQILVSPRPGKHEPEIITLTVPQMTIGKGAVPENSAVELAAESKAVDSSRIRWISGVIAGILLLILAAVWIFRKKGKKIPPKTLKERTLEALSELRGSLQKKEFSAESAAARLSDLIRNYLEMRYRMPFSRRTTPEFIDDLSRNNPLPEEDQPFLRDFLNAADLIKFARMPCDEAGVGTAIASAEKLVEQTAEPEEIPHV